MLLRVVLLQVVLLLLGQSPPVAYLHLNGLELAVPPAAVLLLLPAGSRGVAQSLLQGLSAAGAVPVFPLEIPLRLHTQRLDVLVQRG